MQADPLIAALAGLLPEPVAKLDEIGVEPCAGGGNNRVFTVTASGRRYIAKCYFRHPSDTRDRLKSEFTFLNYAKRIGITCVPVPIACDNERGIGLYEYIDGHKLTSLDIDAGRVDQAADFFLRLNHPSAHPYATDLPNASEACFSIAEHLAMVDARIARLGSVPATVAIEREAHEFMQLLGARWQQAKSRILREAQRYGIDPAAALEERCISPSDFGFHNTLVSPSRGLCFIDFEYAGWDDPAKAIGDFFSHPAVPVDMAHFDRFLTAVTGFAAAKSQLAARAQLLLPVFQAKWCCIILNDFLPTDAQRRRFADPGVDQEARKREQIKKARRLYERITVA
jgi:hypothetical protein